MQQFPFYYLWGGAMVLFLLCFVLYFIWAALPRMGSLEWIPMRRRMPFRFGGSEGADTQRKLDGFDSAIACVLMAIWAVLAFWNLGAQVAPQSFHTFQNEFVIIELGGQFDVGRIVYFPGQTTGSYRITMVRNHESGHSTESQYMTQGDMLPFQWRELQIDHGNAVTAIQIEPLQSGLDLSEIAIYDTAGQRLSAASFVLRWSDLSYASSALFDEPHTVPQHIGFHSGAYGGEGAYIQAADSFLDEGRDWVQILPSAPPLGSALIALGISLFGMTPFAWRFMGVVFGALTIGLLYCFVKILFGKRLVAGSAAVLFGANFMLFVQSRLATGTTFAPLFLLLTFWALYQYIKTDYDAKFRKTILPLALAGLFLGFALAFSWTAWTFIPAVFVLFLLYQILRGRHWVRRGQAGKFAGYLAKTALLMILCLGALPLAVYYLSYMTAFAYAPWDAWYVHYFREHQRVLFLYHQNALLPYYGSESVAAWYTWMLNLNPTLHYRSYRADGAVSQIVAQGNPFVYFGGLLAMLGLPFAAVRRRDGRALAIFIAYLSLLLPWVITGWYALPHQYLASSIFIVLAISFFFNRLVNRGKVGYRIAIIACAFVAITLFALYFPILSGYPMPAWYPQNVLNLN